MFEYGDPEAILAAMLDGATLATNAIGHTALDDFQHFCAVTGCDPENGWAKLAYVWESTARDAGRA